MTSLEILMDALRNVKREGRHDGLGSAIVSIDLYAHTAAGALRELEAEKHEIDQPRDQVLWAECPECGCQVRFITPDDIADLERTVESLGKRNIELDAMLEERNEADAHYLIRICRALGLHKAQSVDLAIKRIAKLQDIAIKEGDYEQETDD